MSLTHLRKRHPRSAQRWREFNRQKPVPVVHHRAAATTRNLSKMLPGNHIMVGIAGVLTPVSCRTGRSAPSAASQSLTGRSPLRQPARGRPCSHSPGACQRKRGAGEIKTWWGCLAGAGGQRVERAWVRVLETAAAYPPAQMIPEVIDFVMMGLASSCAAYQAPKPPALTSVPTCNLSDTSRR